MVKPCLNIVMATDVDYYYMYVAIYSILYNKKKDTRILFHILTNHRFGKESKLELQFLIKSFSNVEFEFIDVGNRFQGISSHVKHIQTPTFYRLIIPELLSADKCLYLDSDIVVCDDLSELYAEDVSSCMVGGVLAIDWQNLTEGKREICCRLLEIPSLKQYINAGVILMNLDQLRKMDFSSQAMNLINKNFPTQDQDIINKLCYGYIKKLSFKYNAMTKYYRMENDYYKDAYSKDEIIKAWNKPIIIHYANPQKPWNSLHVPLNEKWWFYCKKTKMWEYFIHQPLDAILFNSFYECYDGIERRRSIWDKIQFSKYVVIYGAGVIAKRIILCLKEKHINILCLVVTDKSSNPDKVCGIPVRSIKELHEKDVPIIVAVNDSFRAEVINILWEKGFSSVIILRNNEL